MFTKSLFPWPQQAARMAGGVKFGRILISKTRVLTAPNADESATDELTAKGFTQRRKGRRVTETRTTRNIRLFAPRRLCVRYLDLFRNSCRSLRGNRLLSVGRVFSRRCLTPLPTSTCGEAVVNSCSDAAGGVNKPQSANSRSGKDLRRKMQQRWQQITTGVDTLL